MIGTNQLTSPEGGMELLAGDMCRCSHEMELLLCCGGPSIRAENGRRIPELLQRDLDWERLLRLSLVHGMLPLLYWNLVQTREAQEDGRVPAPIMERLRSIYLHNLAQALSMTADLLSILGRMDTAGVSAVPYKGPVLSSRLYGNLGLRQSVDLDVLVRQADVQQARQTLMDLGYSPFIALDDAVRIFQVESRYSETFFRGDRAVELHWAFTNKDVAFPLSLDHLAPRLTSHSISGREIKVFSPEDTILILCVHGAKHGWARLEWICGVAEAASKEPIDWKQLFSRADETRGLRRLHLGLHLAGDLFRMPLTEEVRNLVNRDEGIGDLASVVKLTLFNEIKSSKGIETFGSVEHDLFHFRLGDGFGDRLRYLTYRITTPSRPEKWSTVSFVGRSIHLHALTRPFSVAHKLLPEIWRRIRGLHPTSKEKMTSGTGRKGS